MSRLLLVEDDPDTQSLAERWLRQAGHDVRPARTAEIALDLAEHEHFDGFVLDVVLPALDGFSLAEKLSDKDPSKPLVFLTISDRDEVPTSLAARPWVAKPFSKAQLVATVTEALAEVRG